jgi:hypothetical protein
MGRMSEAKKTAAWKLTSAFLDGVTDEPMFEDRSDRGMVVAMAVMRFVSREAIEPQVYLNWLAQVADLTLVEPKSPEEAELFIEARRTDIWH